MIEIFRVDNVRSVHQKILVVEIRHNINLVEGGADLVGLKVIDKILIKPVIIKLVVILSSLINKESGDTLREFNRHGIVIGTDKPLELILFRVVLSSVDRVVLGLNRRNESLVDSIKGVRSSPKEGSKRGVLGVG